MIYLDNAATTPMSETVLSSVDPFLRVEYGNAGAIYGLGRHAKIAIESAREDVAKFFGTSPEHIVFTSGGSEGNNMVVRGLADHLRQKSRTTILTTKTEHPSVITAVMSLYTNGFDVEYIPVDENGVIKIDELRRMIDDDTGLVAVMYVNNEVGAINPVVEIGKICKENGALFFTDCVQAAAAMKINVQKIGCDFATVSAHKFHGPKGVGAVYFKDTDMLQMIEPIISGSNSQEFGVRGGTENIPGIVGMGTACATIKYPEFSYSNYFIESLKTRFDGDFDDVFHINSPRTKVDNILNIRVNGVDAETLVLLMDSYGVCISAGAACHSHNAIPSATLLAMGMSPAEARSCVRISFSGDTDIVDVAKAADLFANAVRLLLENKV